MNEGQHSIPAKSYRRFFRFSLRTFLIGLTVLCIWLGIKVSDARKQREAVAAIRNLGGSVEYDYHRMAGEKPNLFDPKLEAPGPEWLRSLIGPEYFQDVVLVDLSHCPITDDDLAILRYFPKLETVGLEHTQIFGAGLAHLSEIKTLKQLGLWDTRIDDEALKHLRGLHRLWNLALDENRISDVGLENLEELTDLEEWLGLSHTQITDAGLHHLKKLSKLKHLTLSGTQVTKDGAHELQPFLPRAEISVSPSKPN
jgi:Leucine-rich repeat (LRR) protein